MFSRNKMAILIVAAAVTLFSGQTLLAQQAGSKASENDKQLVKLMSDYHMTLAKAIESAELHSKGHAISAAAHMQGNDGIVSVTVVAGDSEQRLTVDIKTGKVTEAAATPAPAKPHDQSKAKPHGQPNKKP